MCKLMVLLGALMAVGGTIVGLLLIGLSQSVEASVLAGFAFFGVLVGCLVFAAGRFGAWVTRGQD